MHPLIQKIQELVTKLQDKFDEFHSKVTNLLSNVPWGLGWLADKLLDAWNAFVDKWNDFWEFYAHMFSNLGSPSGISQVQSNWNSGIGNPVSAEAGNADAGLLMADEHWTGTAASNYRPRAALQKSALQAIKATLADGATTALDQVRAGLVKFYAALIAALGTFIAGIIGALASTATIFGAPAGPFIAGGATLVAGGAFIGGGLLLESDCDAAKNTLQTKLADKTAFPNGAWPTGALA